MVFILRLKAKRENGTSKIFEKNPEGEDISRVMKALVLFVFGTLTTVSSILCGTGCGTPGHDQVGGKVLAGRRPHTIASSSDADCCRKCSHKEGCSAWVRQPSTTYCWLIAAAPGQKTTPREDRTVGFMSTPVPKDDLNVTVTQFGRDSLRVRVTVAEPAQEGLPGGLVANPLPQPRSISSTLGKRNQLTLLNGNIGARFTKAGGLEIYRVSDGNYATSTLCCSTRIFKSCTRIIGTCLILITNMSNQNP